MAEVEGRTGLQREACRSTGSMASMRQWERTFEVQVVIGGRGREGSYASIVSQISLRAITIPDDLRL